MNVFTKYPHLERVGTDEVEGILEGECLIFPKIDGTNASVWMDSNGNICCGSRKRQISVENDNQGFAKFVEENKASFVEFFKWLPFCILYGEWLVPHTLKTYRKEAWRKFYIFDVFQSDRFIHFDIYKERLESDFSGNDNIEVIYPLFRSRNPSLIHLESALEKNTYLLPEGEIGEGIVIKNYDFVNKYGRVTWAKLVRNAFKEKHVKEMGVPTLDGETTVEEKIVEKFVTDHLVHKVFDKIRTEMEGWKAQYIPRLLNTVWHDLITEEMWSILKEYKNPTIDFKRLNRLTTDRIKSILTEVF
jgi:hypothetical protein